jgi:glycosyltransferase involved in cell wall biosynthesis
MTANLRTSLIIPAYNEEEALPLVINEYMKLVDEIIVVDDGSTDRTYEIATKYNVKLYRHERNMGKVAAIRTGINNATGAIIILTDADYTYPAEYIPKFIHEIEKGADLVLGSRFMDGVSNMPFLNMIGNKIFSVVAAYISCVSITDGQTGYRAFKKDMFSKLDVNAKSLEYETKMTVRAAKLGYKVVEIPIEYRKRIGSSKLRPIRDGYRMFRGLISIAWEETSLIAKTIMAPSILFIAIGLSFGIISIYEKVKFGNLSHDYYPLITTLFILVAIQLISFGLIIDYMTKKLDRIEEKLRSLK